MIAHEEKKEEKNPEKKERKRKKKIFFNILTSSWVRDLSDSPKCFPPILQLLLSFFLNVGKFVKEFYLSKVISLWTVGPVSLMIHFSSLISGLIQLFRTSIISGSISWNTSRRKLAIAEYMIKNTSKHLAMFPPVEILLLITKYPYMCKHPVKATRIDIFTNCMTHSKNDVQLYHSKKDKLTDLFGNWNRLIGVQAKFLFVWCYG